MHEAFYLLLGALLKQCKHDTPPQPPRVVTRNVATSCMASLFFWQATHPHPSLQVGIRGVPAARLTSGMPVGMSDAHI